MKIRPIYLLWSLILGIMVGIGCRTSDSSDTSGGRESRASLTAASNMVHPPFSSWNDEKRAVGMEVDIVEAAAADLGLDVHWVERPFADLLGAVEKGEVDFAVATIGITEERGRKVSFSKPYYETQIVALVRDEESAPASLGELAGKRIGADQATTSYSAARKQWPDAHLVGAAVEGKSWPQMVQEGIIDAFVVDASDQERLQTISKISLRRIEEPISAEFFGVAMRKGASDVIAAVNRAIESD